MSRAMGFYTRFVLPRLLDLAMRNDRLARYRARAIAGAPCGALAARVDAMLATHRRRLSSRPQDGRVDPRGRFPARCHRDRLHARTEAVDLHVSGPGGGLTLKRPQKGGDGTH